MRKEAPDAKELTGLERSGLRRLADAEKPANSLESRFDLAYNAVAREEAKMSISEISVKNEKRWAARGAAS